MDKEESRKYDLYYEKKKCKPVFQVLVMVTSLSKKRKKFFLLSVERICVTISLHIFNLSAEQNRKKTVNVLCVYF
jgi:hypothetical protein